jgi:anti-anti-sigma factor
MPASTRSTSPSCLLDRDPDGVVRLWLVGEFDLAVAPELDAALRQAQADSDRIVVDLRGLTFLDWTCLQTLLAADGCVRRAGARMTIAHPPPAVCKLLDLVGAAKRLTIVAGGRDAWSGGAASRPRRSRPASASRRVGN